MKPDIETIANTPNVRGIIKAFGHEYSISLEPSKLKGLTDRLFAETDPEVRFTMKAMAAPFLYTRRKTEDAFLKTFLF